MLGQKTHSFHFIDFVGKIFTDKHKWPPRRVVLLVLFIIINFTVPRNSESPSNQSNIPQDCLYNRQENVGCNSVESPTSDNITKHNTDQRHPGMSHLAGFRRANVRLYFKCTLRANRVSSD